VQVIKDYLSQIYTGNRHWSDVVWRRTGGETIIRYDDMYVGKNHETKISWL